MKKILFSLLVFGINLVVAQVNLVSGLQACYPLDCDNAVNKVSANSPLLDGAVFNVTCTTGHNGAANTAYQFGGNSNSYIELPDNNLLKSNTISVSGWFNTSDLQPAYLVYVSNGCTSNFEAFSLNFYAPYGFYLTKGDASCTKVQLIPSITLSANTWYHVAFYIDNSIMQLYINNVLYSMNHSIAWGYAPGKKVILGGTREPSYDQPFKGKMDNLLFYDRQLNASEVSALYNGTSPCVITTPTVNLPTCVPTTSLVGWWPFCGNANDESGNAHHGTPVGASLTTDRFGNTNNAYSLNGIANSVFVNDNFFDAGWNEFTISGWYNFNVLTNTNNFNVNQTLINTAPHNGLGISSNWGGNPKHGMLAGNGTPATSWNVLPLITSTQTITVGAWKHFVYTKSGLNYSFYIDGVLDKTTTASISVSSYLYKMYFGGTDPNATNECVSGKIDDYGIWNRKLTQTEITALYNCTASCSNPTVTPTPTITPTPTVTPTSTISVLPLPNVITPNNDGVNDYIDFAQHVLEKEFDFEIFNRWGLSIMKSNSSSKTIWDGTTTSGQKCVDGVYFYFIKTADKSYKGNISLYR